MTLTPVPRYESAVMILNCGHARPVPTYFSDLTPSTLRYLLFNCAEGCGCGLQPVADLLVWKP